MPNKFEMISGGRINKDTVEIICIIDKSGSMGRIRNDAIGGFNTFLEDQKKVPGKANLTRILFSDNDKYQVIDEYCPLEEVEPFTEETYKPGGSTALLDAIGKTLDNTMNIFSNLPENNRPNKVMVIIITDGDENDSIKYSKDQISIMIKGRESEGWEFLFLGANMDAVKEGASIGIDNANNTINYQASNKGIRNAYTMTSDRVFEYRSRDLNGEEDENLI